MSSDSESDDEYVPGEPEQLSEEGSADDETEKQYELEQEEKGQKRKAKFTKGKKRQRTIEPIREKTPEKETKVDSEAEKKREDDLWAMFLDGTDQKPKSAPKEAASSSPAPAAAAATSKTVDKVEDAKEKEKRIFEFAGETIVVENNVIKEKIKTPIGTPTGSAAAGGKSRSSGGLASVLGAIGKNNKLSTLDKSKLDWETFKQAEGIDDEVKAINKGKQGYLERQDFLQRADLRQYEIERDLRMSRRGNR